MSDLTAGWHLKKEIAIGNIITLVAIIVSGTWYAGTLETRLALVEIAVKQQEVRMDKDVSEIKRLLERIDSKLDKKADK